MQQDLSRLTVVLCRARNPQNIGAVARAMHDLAYTSLRIVNDFPVPFQAAKSAVDASTILHTATEHEALPAAIADCTFVLGTTAVGSRALNHAVLPLNTAAAHIRRHLALPTGRVALLFGSEKTGLTNDELSHCQALLTIPMNPVAPKHLSMNLGQAAAVCLYQIAHGDLPTLPPPEETPAPAQELQRLESLLTEVLTASGYTRRHPANSRDQNLRRLIRHMALTPADTPVWTGVLRQLLHTLPPQQESSNAEKTGLDGTKRR